MKIKSIGNYEIIEIIAEHGPTLICKARHKKLGRKTFLKIFKSADPNLLQRFEREARIVADLNDEHIVAIYDFGEENDLYFIAMEYVDGGNLKEYLDAHTLSAEEIINFAYNIAKAVAVLHRHGYIHRDLKPENILVNKAGQVKLTDFGIAYHDALFHMTTEGSLLGTPLYMSPEQINNLPLTPASDVFAMGIIFYQLAVKKHPFEAPRIGEIFSQILSKEVENPCHIRPELPEWFCQLIQKMLEKDPEKRPQSAENILKELEKFRAQIPQPSSPESASLPPRKKTSVWLPIIFFSGLLLLIVFLLFRKANPPVSPPTGSDDSLVAALPESSLTDSAQAPGLRASENRTPENPGSTSKDSTPHTVLPPKTEIIPYTQVFIQTYPWCKIYLNYQLVDSTPMTRPLRLKPGKYVLGLQNPLYPSFADTIFIPAQREYTLTFNLDSIFARLDLQVSPWGKVYIDGKYIGETPLQKPIYLTREKHVIEIKNQFYRTWRDTIDFREKAKVQKFIALKETTK